MKGFFPVIPALVFAFGIDPAHGQADPSFEIAEWAPAFVGVEMVRGNRATPQGPEAIVAIRVDLEAEGIEFVATPGNGGSALETEGETAPQFLKRHNANLALNTAFFSPCCTYFGSEPKDLIGYAVSGGEKISEWSRSKPVAFAISRDRKVSFLRSAPEIVGDTWLAFSGMELLRAGEPATAPNHNRHPRTAVGLSKDSRFLFFLIVDGRQPKHSVGTSLHDTARWLIALGAHEGINLDGGGSTILVIENRGLENPRILNRPSAGLPRVNGAHLGLIARPLR